MWRRVHPVGRLAVPEVAEGLASVKVHTVAQCWVWNAKEGVLPAECVVRHRLAVLGVILDERKY